jgi:hypothetical protein
MTSCPDPLAPSALQDEQPGRVIIQSPVDWAINAGADAARNQADAEEHAVATVESQGSVVPKTHGGPPRPDTVTASSPASATLVAKDLTQ